MRGLERKINYGVEGIPPMTNYKGKDKRLQLSHFFIYVFLTLTWIHKSGKLKNYTLYFRTNGSKNTPNQYL